MGCSSSAASLPSDQTACTSRCATTPRGCCQPAFGLVSASSAIPREQAQTFKGVFANQNIVCKLRDPRTLEFVRSAFDANAGVVASEPREAESVTGA